MKGYLDLTKGSKPFKRSLVTSLLVGINENEIRNVLQNTVLAITKLCNKRSHLRQLLLHCKKHKGVAQRVSQTQLHCIAVLVVT